MAVPPCPCGSDSAYSSCCQPFHSQLKTADTAEQLMRSRYSAYSLQLTDYLVATTHPDQRRPSLSREISDWAAQVEFTGLEILSTWQGGARDKTGKVEFIARYLRGEKQEEMHEVSRFRRYRKDWYYYDGVIS